MTPIDFDVHAFEGYQPADREMSDADRMRALADWLDVHPDATNRIAPEKIYHPIWRADDMARIARSLGGRWDKNADGTYFELTREVVPGVVYQLYINRDTMCERVVTGTTEVTEEIPDPTAPTVSVTKTVEVVEWRCPGSLLAVTDSEER